MKRTTWLLFLSILLSTQAEAKLLYAVQPLPISAPTPIQQADARDPLATLHSSLLQPNAKAPLASVSHTKKLGFWNKLALRMTPKKYRTQVYLSMQDTTEADKKAKTSLIIGAIALGLAIIPWYTIFAAIPLGIVAISMGSRARKMGSTKMTGKGFGIAALVLVGIWFIIAGIAIATWAVW